MSMFSRKKETSVLSMKRIDEIEETLDENPEYMTVALLIKLVKKLIAHIREVEKCS